MTFLQTALLTITLCVLLSGWSGALQARQSSESGSQDVIMHLQEHNRELSRDLRRIQREIAALRAELDEPGVEDVFAGIGYIFGLFGVAALVAARRRR
jgi:nickel transport protein